MVSYKVASLLLSWKRSLLGLGIITKSFSMLSHWKSMNTCLQSEFDASKMKIDAMVSPHLTHSSND